MNKEQKYIAKRFDVIPSNLTICSACYFDRHLYVGMSFKSMFSKPEGVLMVGADGQYIEEPVSHTYDFGDRGFGMTMDIERLPYKRKFEEIGPVYSIKKWNDMLVIGGGKGLLIWQKDKEHKIIPIDEGINDCAPLDDDTLLIGGNKFLGFYKHSTGEVERYPFSVEDIMYLKEIHAVLVMPECFAIGRDVAPSVDFTPAIAFLRKDIQAKKAEVEELFSTHSKEEIQNMIVVEPTYDDQKDKIKGIDYLASSCSEIRPTYVRDMAFWKGWLIVVEHNRSYAIRASDGMVINFSHGGFLIEQNPERPDEFWIGGTWGNGVMIIRYDDKTETWLEDKETFALVNAEVVRATNVLDTSETSGAAVDITTAAYKEMVKKPGFKKLMKDFGIQMESKPYITCIYFYFDKVFVGTEGKGTYLIEKG